MNTQSTLHSSKHHTVQKKKKKKIRSKLSKNHTLRKITV